MLTDLSFLEVGEPWPPEDVDTQKRLALYEKNTQLFDSEAEKVYGRWAAVLRENLEETHYVLSFPRRLSWHWANLVMGEAPEYKVGEPDSAEQKRLAEIVEENELNAVGQEVLVDRSRYGDGLFRLRVEGGKPVIEGQSPRYWFPVVSESNVRRVTHHVLAWKIGRDERTSTAERLLNPAVLTRRVSYLRVEVHTAGQIEHRIYRLNSDDRIEARVANPSEVERDFPGSLGEDGTRDGVESTGLSVPMVFHASGERTTDRLHGYDDYGPIDSSMEYLMWLAAQRQVILHKHSDPSISGPRIDLVSGESGQQYAASGSRYYEIEEGTENVRPEYMTWDGQLTASFRQTEELWKDVYTESHTSPASFNHSETGQATSGTALRLRLRSDLAKAGQIAERFFPVLAKALKAAGELAGQDFAELSITPKDGLPADNTEASQISASDIAAGITSLKSEMKRRYEYTDAQADEELQQMAEERARDAPPSFAAGATNRPLSLEEGVSDGTQEEGQQDPRRRQA